MNAVPSPVDQLAAAFLEGLAEAAKHLAALVDRAELVGVCRTLHHLRWTPLMLQRWAEHTTWAETTGPEVLDRLAALGLPPEAPRSAVPIRQDVCPEHPGERLRVAGVCEECRSAPRPADVAAAAAAVRAARRPFPGAEPPTAPGGITVPGMTGATA